ncbi:MAG TPA: hypothetical protein GXZ56_04735 [Bacteroidales bacterium]|nr:hypothetical protein [Bacteroidales bacterium]
MRKNKLEKRTSRSILSLLLTGLFLFITGCKEKIPEIQIDMPGTTSRYMKLNLSSANHMNITRTASNAYRLTTTGEDPYIVSEKLMIPVHKDSVVLTFEYKSSAKIDFIQVFLGHPITEARSIFFGSLSPTSSWKTASLNLYEIINKLSWGKVGDVFRLDFGNRPGIDIEIKNIYFRALNEEERGIVIAAEEQTKKDEAVAQSLSKYLSQKFSSQIEEVKVENDKITISGRHNGEGTFSLREILPNDTLTTTTHFRNRIPLENKTFRVTVDRKGTIGDLQYDRLLSKWVIVKDSPSKNEIASHARYADVITPQRSMQPGIMKSKKGLGGFFMNQFQSDLDILGIHSITINIPFTAFMYASPGANRIAHQYGNKTYYFARDGYLNGLDQALKAAAQRDIVVAAIILVQKASECADPEIGRLLQHPDFTSEGIYTMPNLTTDESVHCYAAALDFLASRYNTPENTHGRIHKWIMHNEVDAGLSWTNMGRKPMMVYLDTYIKSMRMCHNISRAYDEHSEVMGSYTHSWTAPVELYASKELLENLVSFSRVEGDFQWGVAYHPYPQDLNEPKTWLDTKATFSTGSQLVTFKNLEVIDHWIKQPANQYLGATKRTLWLSENGTNSRTYGEQDLKEQAAGFAYAWKKLSKLDGIDGIQWHNWIDNRHEFGLRIGLRKFPDDESDPGGAKPVWHAYKAADTDEEDAVFDQYKTLIGITNWSEIMKTIH